jgi:ABC-2 type transport system ATP-binding protein
MRTGSVVYHGSIAELRRRAPDPAHRLRTSDDVGAVALAAGRDGLSVDRHGDGLAVRGSQASVDAYVAELVRSGIAPRALALDEQPLEALFFLLTETTPETVPSALTGSSAHPGAAR